MYISELNLHGFKSFAKKEKIKFGEGVTVIVGPNGCGKTNIVDAIRWVLGEQKYSVLRSGKMGDVIFNGADGLKPLSVCEAYLTVHNNSGKLPVEYNDVEIGRRVFRDGESEYYINKTPCRLKDIHDLFIDTGMGSDAYSVIELKMIEQILSETADDRKRMFEEAAGINKYKQQRQSALRKFDAVQRDLDRINDIVQEVEQQVHSLNLQLKRFNRHEKLTANLFENEIALSFIKIHEYKSELIPLRKNVSESQTLKNEKSSDTSLLEKELEEIKKTYMSQQQELQLKQTYLQKLEKDRELAQNNVLIWNEQFKSAEININRLVNELESSQTKKIKLSEQITEFEKNSKLLSPDIEDQRNLFNTKNDEFNKIQDEYLSAQDHVKSMQAARWEAQEKIVSDRSILDRSTSSIDEKTTVIKHLNVKIKNLENDQEKFSYEQKNIDDEISLQTKEVDKIKSEIDANQKKHAKNETEFSSLRMDLHTKKSELSSLESRLSFFNELLEQKEGYPEGAKKILTNQSEYEGLIGPVGELFQIDSKYEMAFQSALGSWVKCLVVKDKSSAMKILSLAKAKNLGNFSILPLKELKKFKTKKSSIPKVEGILGRALDLCGVSKLNANVAEALLGNLLIVEDINKIQSKTVGDQWDLVDLNGAYVGKNMLLKYQNKSKETSIIGRQKKIQAIQKQIKSLEKEIDKNEAKYISLEVLISDLIGSLSNLDNKYNLENNHLNEMQSIQIKNHYKQSQNLNRIKELNKEVESTQKNLDILNEKVSAINPSIIDTEKLIKKLQKEIEATSKSFSVVQQTRDNFQQKVQELRIDLLNMENRFNSIALQKESATKTSLELENRDNEINKETNELSELKKSLDIKIVNEENELNNISGDIAKERSVLDLKQQTVTDTFESMETVQEKINSEQILKETLFEQQKTNELMIVELDQKINNIKERMMDKYNSKIPKDMRVDSDIDDLELEIEKIQKGLDNIGPLNMAAQQDYEEEQKRLENLIDQRIDILKSEDNLKETITKIDIVAREKFESTFDQINTNFSKLFGMFFEGGSASLSLDGSDDSLEAQIAIHAQPPGKKNQNLRMLSAGEKSLTAIALLFAIYQYKPSPYCVLDEVDAPLDDVNIQKFKRVLNEFAQDTQFIVVTHNKLTMEVADYLYGVTMEKKGVSKLVSVKFKGEA